MTNFLKLTDFLLIYLLIALWIGDFFSMRRVGKVSAYISELLKKDAEGLQIALEEPANFTEGLQKLVTKKVRAIHRWYWLANKTLAMIGILALQQWLVMTAKQNWGLIVLEVIMLVICGIILAADFRVNIVRSQLEKALKPYEDRLWFEYKLRS
ncbi:hypothetical protein [Lentilactobacillus farraginis]|uniref:Uncharacterized protein n=1 Tax=Lentilactobacillus farraginis DSM 18382 = JCM 14108 TaxID=1423743 RepID=X0PC31_9LACO|nr:hypothetical protein [Lentilactobacillus farraginis]KRM09302.1 hypothetical protein FD41_GL002666 [Lentilactobacillus farraginis DSM 18382 = JCM 14108]GAF37753.1 hypothetical protein JCM14108_2811 [Lentilactobacillus farraginis DSM 18382 = JCM 14108]